MKSRLYLTLIGSAAIALGATSFASAACMDDVAMLHGQMVTGSVSGQPEANNPPATSANPAESKLDESSHAKTQEFAATGNATFDSAIHDAAAAGMAGDETACRAALERARGAM